MLDTVTKRRIDSARDILVGKVPDPKSQVEQITIALIYKFMDDMDAQAEELGGKRKFFAGEFKKYGWANLMSPATAGEERIALYAEGIVKMPQNPGVPKFFRDIFKNAFLPYRDPETLKLFLKEIDGFSYDHSERLGDAFEYLLSVLGSQGDAGQFRTPRHIIDFIVKIVNPKKTDSILDPACGTAGFLISAYKHVLEENKDDEGKRKPLTPDEKKKLAANLKGYDISPDMIRLSLVNMYLHGFTAPNIEEYDTLTSQDKWNETADVILANPPFMSPKGGIKPHDKFSVKSKRSEVLFVDYMAEHLTPGGRAGIIVPEGIIFQSQTAYKTLRKMLVEQYLVAVVSLPAGVFQPYSNVKTSILLFDKSLAKHSDVVGFFKISNDGFDLGAQRRPIDKSDLPQVQQEVAEFLKRLRGMESTGDFTLGLVVAKEKLVEGDYNLSGERYREGAVRTHSFPHVTLNDVCTINPPKSEGFALPGDTLVSFVPMSDLGENRMAFVPKETKRIDELGTSYTYFADGDVLVAKVTPCFENGKAGIARNLSNGVGFGSSEFYVLRPSDRVLAEFIYFCVTHQLFRAPAIAQMTGTGGLQRVPKSYVEQFEIPLPPLEVQKEIVAEIEAHQRVSDGARAVLDHYRPHIPIQPDWPMVELGELCEINSGGTPKREVDAYWNGEVPWITTSLIDFNVIDRAEEFITREGLDNSSAWIVPKGTVVMAMFGQGVTRGRVATLGIDAAMNQACAAFTIRDERVNSAYLYHALRAEYENLRELSDARGGNQSNLSGAVLKQYTIPLPPVAEQEKIVAEIEAEQSLVDGNRKLIKRMEQKIAATLARVWGDEQPAQRKG